LLISGQVVGRLVRRNSEDAAVLRALGAGPSATTADALIGIFCSVAAGSLLALVVAIGLSPSRRSAPFGPFTPTSALLSIGQSWASVLLS
jgi:hypothetical protein